MAQYTTGEVAKLCGVSVRTVQYYDSRNILVPSALSEGGRRLYSQEDVSRLKIICFLRDLELPIDSIKKLLEADHPEEVISLLFQEQENRLRQEIAQKQERADKLSQAQRALGLISQISVQSIGDIAYAMENKRQLRRLRARILMIGIPLELLEIGSVLLWVFRGLWLPFAAVWTAELATGIWMARIYYRETAYICPECHAVFQPRFRESLFAWHTPNTRKLTCTGCGHHGFCIETYGGEETLC